MHGGLSQTRFKRPIRLACKANFGLKVKVLIIPNWERWRAGEKKLARIFLKLWTINVFARYTPKCRPPTKRTSRGTRMILISGRYVNLNAILRYLSFSANCALRNPDRRVQTRRQCWRQLCRGIFLHDSFPQIP